MLVIGGGAAGLGAAIKAKDSVERVILAERAKVGRSGCSPFAAGIWTIKFPEDDTDAWMKEIIEWGEYLSDQEWVKTFLERIEPVSTELERWGQEYGKTIFEKDEKGNFIRRKSRGHLITSHCIMNSIPMIDTMTKKAQEKGVTFAERVLITDLATLEDGRTAGAIGFNYRTGDIYLFKAKAVVAAAGQATFGKIFLATKNLNGGVITAAYRAGAELKSLENTISNTCARDFDIHGLNLIVSVGGRLINQRDEEFMWDYHPILGNRARLQDLVIAFCQEVKEGRGPIYLDMSRASTQDQQLMKKILPHSFKTWDRSGIDFFKDKIPWVPVFMGGTGGGGGVRTNTLCESNVPGLYAAGDSSNLAHHGTYSIGGLCITYAYLSGCIAGENAAKYTSSINKLAENASLDRQVKEATKNFVGPLDRDKGISPDRVLLKIQEIMVPWGVSFIRNEPRLSRALTEVEQIREEEIPSMKAKDLHELAKVQDVRSLGLLAELILRSALFRKESRGFHHREDYPYTDNKNWLKWVLVKQEGRKPKIWTEDVPTPYFRPTEPIAVPPGVKKMKGGV